MHPGQCLGVRRSAEQGSGLLFDGRTVKRAEPQVLPDRPAGELGNLAGDEAAFAAHAAGS